MLAAVSGLAYLLSTLLRLEASLGYFLPLPIVIAAMRSGGAAGWRTMAATTCLILGEHRVFSVSCVERCIFARFSCVEWWKPGKIKPFAATSAAWSCRLSVG